MQQRELHLVGRERNATLSQCRVGHTHLCRGVVADSDRPDPSRLDGIRHQRHQLRDVHTSRREVVLIEIDFIPSQTGKARVERGGQVVGAPERARGKLRGDHDVATLSEFAKPPSDPPPLYMAAVSKKLTCAATLASNAVRSPSTSGPPYADSPASGLDTDGLSPGHHAQA